MREDIFGKIFPLLTISFKTLYGRLNQTETAEKLQAKAQNAQLVAEQISELKLELESLKTLANSLPTKRRSSKC